MQHENPNKICNRKDSDNPLVIESAPKSATCQNSEPSSIDCARLNLALFARYPSLPYGCMTEIFENAGRACFYRDIISSYIDIIGMNSPKPAQWFEQIAHIQRMERGKLSVMREGPEGPYYKHQVWENGKNLSRYVSGDQAAAVQEAIGGYHKFQQLTEQYAQQVIDKTRAELAANSKKKKYNLRRKSSWPKTRRSSR
jgi:hypothetical protein